MSERGRFVNPFDVKLIDLFTNVKLVIICFVHDKDHNVILVIEHLSPNCLFTDILHI